MNIAIVVWDLTVSGGTQRQALELASQLKKSNDVTIYCYVHDSKRCYPQLSKRLNIISLHNKHAANIMPPAGVWNRLYGQFHIFDKAAKELAKIIPTEIDILNPHDQNTEIVSYLYKKQHPNTKTVMMINDIPSVFFLKERVKEYTPKSQSLKKQIGMSIENFFHYIEELRIKKYLRYIDEIVVLDQRNRKLINKYFDRKAHVIRSGIDLSKFVPLYKKANSVFTILATGIFFPWRRFEDLIKAGKILKNSRIEFLIKIVGKENIDIAYSNKIRTLVNKLGLNTNVKFLGAVSEMELHKNYREADAFVFPNHNQTWGLAVVEAMASGTPVLVSRSSGVHEIISNKKNGILVSPCDPKDLARNIQWIISHKQESSKMAVAARKYVEENLSWAKYSEDMLKIFNSK